MRRIVLAGMASVFCMSGNLMGSHWGNDIVEIAANNADVFEQMSKQIEILSKTVDAINQNHFDTPADRNKFVHASMEKEEYADNIAEMLTRQFLQHRITADDPQLEVKLKTIYTMLQALAAIEESIDIASVEILNKSLLDLEKLFAVENHKVAVEEAQKVAENGLSDLEATQENNSEQIIANTDPIEVSQEAAKQEENADEFAKSQAPMDFSLKESEESASSEEIKNGGDSEVPQEKEPPAADVPEPGSYEATTTSKPAEAPVTSSTVNQDDLNRIRARARAIAREKVMARTREREAEKARKEKEAESDGATP